MRENAGAGPGVDQKTPGEVLVQDVNREVGGNSVEVPRAAGFPASYRPLLS